MTLPGEQSGAPPSRHLPTSPSAALAEPLAPVNRAWTARFTLVWFGVWLAQLTPIQLALPDQLTRIDPHGHVRDFGIVNGVAGAASLIALPLFGALCDRTRSRWGRRRVWVAAGVVVFAVGLLLTGAQTSVLGVVLAWLVASLGMDMMITGLTATVADEVPDQQRGLISGAIYGPQAVGVVVGLLAVQGLGTFPRYLAVAVLLVVASAWFVLRYRDLPASAARPPLTLSSVVRGLWIDPRANPDFGWAFGGRLLVNLSNAFGTAELLFFLRDGLGFSHRHADSALLQLTLIYLVFTLVATYAGGVLSDRTGRRRVFVAVAACLQGLSGLLLALFPTFGMVAVGAALMGAGYGAFMSVDQALVTAVLPDAEDRAKDLGIMNIGSGAPQTLGPLLATVVIDSLGGYAALFGSAAVLAVLGAVSVRRVRSVR